MDEERVWAGIPPRQRSFLQPLFAGGSITRTPAHDTAFRHMQDAASKPGSIVVLVATSDGRSNNGTGKTTDLCAIIAEFRSWRRVILATGEAAVPTSIAKYVHAAELLRECEGDSSSSESQVIKSWTRPVLLAIDEVDKAGLDEPGYKGKQRLRLFKELIDARYRAGDRSTLLATNLTEAEFHCMVGRSVFDRVRECGGFIVTDWQPVRRFVDSES